MDSDLVGKINSGTCFAFVGSGPSTEVGYMSWKELAENVFREIKKRGIDFDNDSYEKYLKESKLPEIFGFASRLLGKKDELIKIVKSILPPRVCNKGQIYEYICRWPFACYLTTNYDDEIDKHLTKINVHYPTIINRKKDLAFFRNGAYGVIAKVHSDLNNPESVVITDDDYSCLYSRSEAAYFRKKMQQIFEMFDILIIGYSLADKDISYILEEAKETASPEHPIYMIMANATAEEEAEYYRKYNIRIIRYHDVDGTHAELKYILKRYDPFIFDRNKLSNRNLTFSKVDEKLDAAISLFLYQHLHEQNDIDYLSPMIMNGLFTVPGQEMSLEEVLEIPIIKPLLNDIGNRIELITSVLELLEKKSFILKLNGLYSITTTGISNLDDISSIRIIQKDQAYGQFQIDMFADHIQISDDDLNNYKQLAEKIIITCFEKRGITIANQVYAGTPVNPQEVSDIFGYISLGASQISDSKVKSSFIFAMHHFLVKPSETQREYLMSISQGYFLYHLLGLDPSCAIVRKDIFTNTLWICDSSIILPYVAIGCHEHEYANDFFRNLRENNAQLMTTEKIIHEVLDHFIWARDFINQHTDDFTELLRLGLVQGSYTQNLFIDGYIRMCGDGEILNFREYIGRVFPMGASIDSIKLIIGKAGISTIPLINIIGSDESSAAVLNEFRSSIEAERMRKGTYKSPNQVATEAEILFIIDGLRQGKHSILNGTRSFEKYYFISHSRVLDNIGSRGSLISWHPESLYRYLVSLPHACSDSNLLQQCMTNSYFYAGVPYIDTEKYLRFFGSNIRESKLKFEAVKDEYAKLVEKDAQAINETFYSLPDLEKPLFVDQMGWKMARLAEKEAAIVKIRMQEAEKRAASLQNEKDRNWKRKRTASILQDEATERNKQDPKHVKKLARRAKKRRKKK